MKVDELLKRLENIKTDEDERREIAEYLARKLSVNNSVYAYYIMTKYKIIRDIKSYKKLLKFGGISPGDAYVYVDKFYCRYDSSSYLYPFFLDIYLLPYAYLSKLGFSSYGIVPATGLKYFAVVNHFLDVGRIVVEVANIDNAAINMNLPTLIRGILGTKRIDNNEVEDTALQLNSQRLFAGYDSDEAWRILNRYYGNHDTSLDKEVEAIRNAYNHIFKPFRIMYDLKTKQFQVSDNNEDR